MSRREVDDMKTIVEGLIAENNKLRSKLKEQDFTMKSLEKVINSLNSEILLSREQASKNMTALLHARYKFVKLFVA